METQNIEYKESWRDEYLKWICGFANAQGGILYIGLNDKGEVVGLDNAKRLLEDIPNKVKDILGIIVDVNLKRTDCKSYLEIITDPYPVPVNYKGQYHYRSGSTKQELKGVALDRFMLRKQGKTWDGVPVPYLTIQDLNNEAFKYFRKEADAPKPKYRHKGDDFWTIFNFKKVKSEVDEVEEKRRKDSMDSTQKNTLKTVEKIILEMRRNPAITIKTLALQLGLSRRGIEEQIKQLKSKGLIRRIGPDKGGHWEVQKSEEESKPSNIIAK